MKTIFYSPLICLLLLSLNGHCQRFENAYLQNGNESALDVAEMSDGSIITVGSASGYGNGGYDMMVMKTNASGNVLWTRYYGGTGDDGANAVVISPQQEIYVAGSTTAGGNKQGYIVKLNAGGGLIWARSFGSGTNSDLRDIGFKSSRIYAVGVTNGAGAGGNDIWMLKTDTAGNVIQNKTLGTAASDEATALCFTSDGNIAFCGQSLGHHPNSVILAKINLSCDTLWTRKFDLNLTTNNSGYIARGIAQLTTQELIFTGTGFDVGNYPSSFHIKTDLSGNTIFTKWTSFLSDEGYDVVAGKNGGYYLLSNVCNFGCRAYIVKFDNAGNQLQSTQYGYPGTGSYGSFTAGRRIFINGNSRIFLAGTSFLNAYNNDILLARLDSNGVAYTTPAPQITASGPTTFCAGAGTRLIAPAGYSFYCWARMVSGSLTFLRINNDTISPASTGAYYCICWTGNSYRISNIINVTVNTPPSSTVTASGSLNFCAASGDSVILTAPSGFTYQWLQNGMNIPGATSNTYSAKSSGSYHVQITSTCGSTSSQLFQVNANSIVQNPLINCNGDCFSGGGLCYPPGYLSASAAGGGTITNYQWFVDGTPYGPGGAGASQVVPPYPAGNYTCVLSNGCGSATSTSYQVQSGPSTGPSGTDIHLTQPAGCGLGSNITLQAPIGSTGPYQWLLNGSTITGATNYWHIAQQSGWYSLQYYDPYCMTGNTTPSLNIQLNTPNPVLTAPNGLTNCTGSVLLSVTTPGSNFQWFKDDVSLGPIGTSSSYTATQSGVYKCSVYNPVCGWDMTNSLAVTTGSVTPVLSSTGNVICAGSTTIFSCNPSSGSYSYQWFRNGNPISGATSSSYSTGVAGSYSCNLTNACASVPSNSISLSLLPTPTAAIVPPASTVICTPQLKTLAAVPVPGCTYQWLNGSSQISGANDSIFQAAAAGSYSVRLKQGVCSAVSAPVALTTATGVTATVSTSGYPQICTGESFTMSATPQPSYTYQWKRNGNNINGATSAAYTTGTAGTYEVNITNACGSLLVPASTLVVKSKPSAATTALGPLSFCAGDSVQLQTTTGNGFTYFWKRNGNIISGATSATYTAKTAGNFRAGVYSQFGCLKESSILTVSIPCREGVSPDMNEEFSISLYPNPTSGACTLSFNGTTAYNYAEIIITDVTGRIIDAEITSVQDGYQITVPEPGVFLITVMNGEQWTTKRLIRIN